MKDSTTILMPLEPSFSSEDAAIHVLQLARLAGGARVEFVVVAEGVCERPEDSAADAAENASAGEEADRARIRLERFIATLDTTGLEVKSTVLPGSRATSLREHVASSRPSLVVMYPGRQEMAGVASRHPVATGVT